MMKKAFFYDLVVLSAFLLVAYESAGAQALFSFDVEGGLRYEDNVGFAPRSRDKTDDFITEIGGAVHYTALSTKYHQITLSGKVGYEHFFDVEDISNIDFGVAALYRGQLSTDLTAPWYGLEGELTGLYHNDNDIRDGYKFDLTATVGKRLNEKLGASVGYRYHLRRSTDEIEVFDLDKHGAFAHMEFAPAISTTFYGEYSFFSGDTTATGRLPFNDGATFVRYPDLAFGPDFIVWRIDADVHIGEIGVKHRINDNLQLDLSGQYLKAFGESDNDYENARVSLTANYRF